METTLDNAPFDWLALLVLVVTITGIIFVFKLLGDGRTFGYAVAGRIASARMLPRRVGFLVDVASTAMMAV